MVGPDDPYWLESDRNKALAWMLEETLKCNVCQTRLEEWDEDRMAYVADSYRCTGCEKVHYEQEILTGTDAGPGFHVRLRRPDSWERTMMPHQTER